MNKLRILLNVIVIILIVLNVFVFLAMLASSHIIPNKTYIGYAMSFCVLILCLFLLEFWRRKLNS